MANQVIFKRSVWRRNKEWPEGWEPFGGGRKTYVKTVGSADEARSICKQHNDARSSKGDPFCEYTAESNY